MNNAGVALEELDLRRRRLHFRCWHRGMRETDLLLGRFADATIAVLSEEELADFEELLEVPDRDILGWIIGELVVPPEADTPLMRKILAFHGADIAQATDGNG